MKHRKSQGEDYINQYPHLKKWIVQCQGCQIKGYIKETPDFPKGVSIQDCRNWNMFMNIRKFFKLLELDEFGFCEMCRK